MYSRPQQLVAEFIGTFVLVLLTSGAVCADHLLRSSGQPGIGAVGFAIAYGLSVGVAVAALGPISGGHFNPAVTMAFWVTRRVSTFTALGYCAMQTAGALAGAYFLRLLPFDVWTPVRLGVPELATGVTRGTGMVFEGMLTFFVVLVVFGRGGSHRGPGDISGAMAVAAAVTAAAIFGGPVTGAALNPARAFGPAVAASYWTNQAVYWIGPLAGGAAAGWLFDALMMPKKPA